MKSLILGLTLLSSSAFAARFVVEAKHTLSVSEIAMMENLEVSGWPKTNNDYFSRLYSVQGNISKEALQNLSWVRNVEETIELQKLSLTPSDKPTKLVEDELLPYQWYLQNEGQTFVKEKDDIHNIPLQGVAGKDIKWSSIYNSIPAGRPIVAVLDSGVDIDHPELKNNLWKNTNECGKDDSVDNDKNTLPGDCHGWNFTASLNSPEAKLPVDTDGHGTHVAGLIAAANNGEGIVGVNPNALIMPIKVIKDSNSNSQISSSESFSQGIIYAVNMGAHVINLSLGWPKSLETKHLRDAILYALSRNVIIVAAAGNNNSSEPLFPCAYDGVICVGSTTLNGEVAGFSNFGGHVDALTPGEGILSLNPMTYEPEFFSVPGFDVKSGTSQSAPILSGLLSILKAQNPDLTINDAFARIFQAKTNSTGSKYILGGDVTWESLSKKVEHAVIRPVLKNVRQVVLQGLNKNADLIIPFRNYGPVTGRLSAKVESLTKNIEILNGDITIDGINSNEIIPSKIQVVVKDLTKENNLKLKITIVTDSETKTLVTEVPVVRNIINEANFEKQTFNFSNSKLPLGKVDEGKIVSFLSTMETYGDVKSHNFYLRKVDSKNRTIEINTFERIGSEVVQGSKPIILENAVNIINLFKVDLNLDGKADFVIQTLNEDENEKRSIEFSFYNDQFEPLWRSFPKAAVLLDVAVKSLNTIHFVSMNHKILGKILVPAFFTEGQIARIDQAKDFMGRFDSSAGLRLYYLEPNLEKSELVIRTLTNHSWMNGIKTKLSAQWFDTVLVENILPVSHSDAKSGELRVILSVGQKTKRQIYIAKFSADTNTLGENLNQIVIQTEGVDGVQEVTKNGLKVTGESYLNIYDRARGKVINTENLEFVSQRNYTHESQSDILIGQIANFKEGNKSISILQSREELISLTTENGKTQKSTRAKLRYSFFSSSVLSEMYFPVVYKREEALKPALYVDSTSVTGNRIYLLEEQKGELVASIKNSLAVTSNCRAMNPHFNNDKKITEFVFLCLENKDFVLRTYPMM